MRRENVWKVRRGDESTQRDLMRFHVQVVGFMCLLLEIVLAIFVVSVD